MSEMEISKRGGKLTGSHLKGLISAGALALALAGCSSMNNTIHHGYIADPQALAQVHVGEPAEQVLALLGDPTTTSTVGGGAWYYISQKSEQPVAFMKPKITDQHVYAVYFDDKKKVTRIANYGMKDGKVFDFISRTTPTTGSEPNFIGNMVGNLLRF